MRRGWTTLGVVTRRSNSTPPRAFADALSAPPPGGRSWFRKDPRATIAVRRFAGPASFRERLGHLLVVHLTDLHVGRVTPLVVQEAAIALANAERPDLVVITGDFVCHSQKYLDELTALMKQLTAPVLGVARSRVTAERRATLVGALSRSVGNCATVADSS